MRPPLRLPAAVSTLALATRDRVDRLRDVRHAGPQPRRPRESPGIGGSPRRRRLVAGAAAAAVLVATPVAVQAGGVLDVREVSVVGLEGSDASAIRRALVDAAEGRPVPTLSAGELRRAVASRESVADVELDRRPPHAVQIVVTMHRPVARIAAGGEEVAVDGRGRVLRGTDGTGLPLLHGRAEGGRLGRAERAQAVALAAAPDELLARASRVSGGRVSVRLADGPLLILGDARRTAAKWRAAVVVLADGASAGAGWIDLRVPDRPVAGTGAPPADVRPGTRARLAPSGGAPAATAQGVPPTPTDEAADAPSPTPQESAPASTEATAPATPEPTTTDSAATPSAAPDPTSPSTATPADAAAAP